MKKRPASRFVVLFLVALVLVVALNGVLGGGKERERLSLAQFQAEVERGRVKTAVITESENNGTVKGQLRNGVEYEVDYPGSYGERLTALLFDPENRVDAKADPEKDNVWLSVLFNLLPILLVVGLFIFLVNQMQGGGSRVMQFGKAKAKQVNKDQPKITFADVAGAHEAVAELQEIKEFLEAPAKFQAMGAKIPKGVLLYGPPGTGKTLLARAVAGEAGVPFFSISGSDFVEMFVGVGASRVRDLFEQAKASAPAIIFMDEIDAVGRHRGAGLGGGHDEREQTLNQLLVEMDGFDQKTGVILIASTNRPDILDPALLRPGRFDRQIVVERPDLGGRTRILEVHAKGKPLADDVKLDVLARRTPGFTGADLANTLNEAALLAARRGDDQIHMRHVEEAIDRVLAGPEQRSRVMSEKDKRVTAYHEAGHTLVGHLLPDADPVHKVSIVARGRALGLTWSLPEDRYGYTRGELKARIAMALGGRTAEEIVFGEITTGAANDIEKATQIARDMVTEFGMSDVLGPQQLGQKNGEVFLGRDYGHQANYSDAVAARIDDEIRAIIEDGHEEARAILEAHRDVLDQLAAALIEKETLDTPELAEIMGDLEPWPGRHDPRAKGRRRTPARSARASGRVAAEEALAARQAIDRPVAKPNGRGRAAKAKPKPKPKPAFGT